MFQIPLSTTVSKSLILYSIQVINLISKLHVSDELICACQSFAIFKFLPSVGALPVNSVVLYYCIGPRPSELYGKFTWRIDNFSQINKRELRSNSFDVGGFKWYGLIVINWTASFLCFYCAVSGLLTCLLFVIWLLFPLYLKESHYRLS